MYVLSLLMVSFFKDYTLSKIHFIKKFWSVEFMINGKLNNF